MMTSMKSLTRAQLAAIIVATLGYFVDVYDLILFSIVRVASLKELGVPDADLLRVGVQLLNSQMFGMLVGGVLWGIWGDKRGRLSVLFGSILMYSVANIANGLVGSVTAYAWLRFIAGVGLAGELGAGITLVSEIMPKEKRGYATTIVATIGVLGALAAVLVGDVFAWRTAFFIGGGMGVTLLVLRVSVHESGLFKSLGVENVSRGSIVMLFNSWERFTRYIKAILTGLPIWCVLGVLVTFSPELARAMGIAEPVSAGNAVFYAYVGLVAGDLASGLLSQLFQTRRRVLAGFVILTGLCSVVYLLLPYSTPRMLYMMCVPLGFAAGYWAVFVSSAAEQFGTNLRSTVATSVPNFVRGAVVPLTFSFEFFTSRVGILNSGIIISVLSASVALFAVLRSQETFHRDLNFVER